MTGKGDFCLVTVSTTNYCRWTMTMIFSFLQSNKWYNGDIVIITNDLSVEDKAGFNIFPRILFVTPSPRLLLLVHDLCSAMPGFTNMAPMFYSLELFNLTGYKKILFLDSDMLVVKPIEEVFNFNFAFGACEESCRYNGKGRRADTYEAVESHPDPAMFIANPVNSGFMVLDESLINKPNYEELINMIRPELWANKNTFHADQLIINLFFRDRIERVSAAYNFRPTNHAEIFEKDGIAPGDAKIIHYFRQYKPWNFSEVFELCKHDMVQVKSFRLWYTWYIEFLKFNHIQHKIKILKQNEFACS